MQPVVNGGNLWTPPEPERPKVEPAPEPEKVIEGSVIGYRAWRIRDWVLTGTGVNRAWHPGVNEATCDAGSDNGQWSMWLGGGHGRHPAPHIGCHCGITCLARFDEGDSHWTNADVFGAIEAWSDDTIPSVQPGDVAAAAGVEVRGDHNHPEPGRFILHGNGFRAQYGKVVLLAVDDDWPAAKKAAVRALAAEHEADVCRRSHLEDAAKEHGQLVPDELLEWAREAEPPRGNTSAYMASLTAGMQQIAGSYAVSTNMLRSSLGYTPIVAPAPTKPQKIEGWAMQKKGICQTLGYPGPPSHGKYRKGDRVRDRNGAIWTCSKGGKPGYWEGEGDDA